MEIEKLRCDAKTPAILSTYSSIMVCDCDE